MSDALGNTNALAGRLSGLMLGSTGPGSVWAYKALHPSNEVTPVRGIPDKSCLYTTFQNYRQQISINPTELFKVELSGDLTQYMWNMDIIQNPHPLYPLRIHVWRDGQALADHLDFMVVNNQLGVDLSTTNAWDIPRLLNKAFSEHFERYRIAYQGVTVNTTASEMFDQGTVTATQYTWTMAKSQNFNIMRLKHLWDCFPSIEFGDYHYDTATGSGILSTMNCGSIMVRDKQKTYDQLIQMPLSYTGTAKLGIYQPLKLTDFEFHNTDDLYYYLSDSFDNALARNEPTELDKVEGNTDTVGDNCKAADVRVFLDPTREAELVDVIQRAEPSGKEIGYIGRRSHVDPPQDGKALRLKIDHLMSLGLNVEDHRIVGPLSNIWNKGTVYGQMDNNEANYNFWNMNLTPIPAFCGNKFGQISFRGLSSNNPLILTFRQGIETVVTPGEVLSMYAQPSISPDEMALQNYARMVNILSDAWPAYYNDWNKLKQKLLEAWAWFKPYGAAMGKALMPIVTDMLYSFL